MQNYMSVIRNLMQIYMGVDKVILGTNAEWCRYFAKGTYRYPSMNILANFDFSQFCCSQISTMANFDLIQSYFG